MRITFFGAARTTTGSMHLVEAGGSRWLLDCGLYQGKRKEAFERNRNLPFDASTIDRVLLSHAHIDHSGNVPTLLRRGFRGEILATPATVDLCEIMLRDSAQLQERDVEFVNVRRRKDGKNPFEPLYGVGDVDRAMKLFRPLPYGERVEIAPGVTAAFHDAGHILGSAVTTLDYAGASGPRRLLFTGDLGQKGMPILRDPVSPEGVTEVLTESTYGDRVHPPKADVQGRLKAFVEDVVMQRSKLLIPSFSVGRTQQILYYLNELREQGRIPGVPVYVDSPLSAKATEVYARHRECYDVDASRAILEGSHPFQFRGLVYVSSTEDSIRLNEAPGPAVIISASGMCEGGRILHHLRHNLPDPRTIVLIVGYQAEHTLGRRLVEHVSPVNIFGEAVEVQARVHTINALSAHADREGLMGYLRSLGPSVRRAAVVHGEPDAADSLASALRAEGWREVTAPGPGESLAFGE